MKRYPRIKKLSTLGIVHHQAFDYEFNPFRTDFVGEGGSGKSMIADILQLIFVGSKAFHSPTDSSDPRIPKTMVLRTSGKGTDIAYAFVNIEMKHEEYIIVGIYLESTGSSQSFIIQAGENFETENKMVSINKVLGVSCFLREESLLPIEEFKNHIFDTQGYVCESWTRLNKFHKLLFENYILPVDLSASYESLKSYAKIIQAFSRESLDIKRSEKIQDFLFGNEKEIEFNQVFKTAVEELSGDIKQYESNREEIDKLKHKQTELQQLLLKKQERDKVKKEYVLVKHSYLTQQIDRSNIIMKSLLTTFYDSQNSLKNLRTIAEAKIDKLKGESSKIDKKFEIAQENKLYWDGKSKRLVKFFSWMQHFNKNAKEILKHYENYHKNKKDIENIEYLENRLQEGNILSFLNKNGKFDKHILLNISQIISDVENSLKIKLKLKLLNNIDDSFSLAYWALNLNRKLTLEEESVIHKYQNENVTTKVPEGNEIDRHIPHPEVLLENLPVCKKTDKGFWLDLNGVMEYVPYILEPIFDTGDSEKIKQYFTGQKSSLEKDIEGLQNEEGNWKSLKVILTKLDNPSDYISSWESRAENSQFEHHELFDASKNDIIDYLKLYSQNKEIDKELKKVNNIYNIVDKKRSTHNTLIDSLETTLKTLTIPDVDGYIENITNKYAFESLQKDNGTNEKLEKSKNYYQTFLENFQEANANRIKVSDLEQIDLQIDENIKVLEALKTKNTEVLKELGTINKIISVEELDNKEINFTECEKIYRLKFDLIVKEFLKNKENRYAGTDDFNEICIEILPRDIFDKQDLEDEEIIPRIEKLLSDINIKNKRLNIRKLQKLTSIIDKVNNEVSEQLYDVRKISKFIDSEDKTITGGHRAKLELFNNNSFPREWMEKFIEQIREDIKVGSDDNLFESLQGISNDLEKFTSLEEKMQEAFYRCGGSKLQKPKVRELLNPKSYYGLSFKIKSLHGKKNPGSTSQTYSAIALLCISRLSLINRTAKGTVRDGIRFMPIDEAEGLGSNFDMLYDIAKANDYQILSLSIQPNKVDINNQYIYLLHNNLEESDKVNYDPVPIFGSFKDNDK